MKHMVYQIYYQDRDMFSFWITVTTLSTVTLPLLVLSSIFTPLISPVRC